MPDISEAYIQSTKRLERDVHIRSPKEMGIGNDSVLKGFKTVLRYPRVGSSLVSDLFRAPLDPTRDGKVSG